MMDWRIGLETDCLAKSPVPLYEGGRVTKRCVSFHADASNLRLP